MVGPVFLQTKGPKHTLSLSLKGANQKLLGCGGQGLLHLQRGEGLQGVEGSRGDGGDLVVVQREQADVAQAREAVVVDAADTIVPQHPGGWRRGQVHTVPCAHYLRGTLATGIQLTDSPWEARAVHSTGMLPLRPPPEPPCL